MERARDAVGPATQSSTCSRSVFGCSANRLATNSASASSRFDLDLAPWYRVDGVRLAKTAAAFMSGQLDAALNVQATGEVYAYHNGQLWTGYGLGGPFTAHDLGTATCNDWTSAASGKDGGHGSPYHASTQLFGTGDEASCSTGRSLVCLQQ